MERYADAIEHSRKDLTLGGHSCVVLEPGKRFKVICADHDPGSPLGILGIIAVDAVGSPGCWAFSYGAITFRR